MYGFSKKCLVFLTIASLFMLSSVSLASSAYNSYEYDQLTAGAMAADAILVRPLGIVATVAGFGLFVVSAPFSLLGGNAGDAWYTLVKSPAEFTFVRPLGAFEDQFPMY